MNQYVTGAAIRELREKNHLTQVQLAQKLNVSDKTISKWETGKGYPDITLLELIAKALNVSLSELLGGGELSAGECMGLGLERVAFLACRGGWPQTIRQREKIALMRAFDYYGDVVNSDISRADNVTREPDRVNAIGSCLIRIW